MRALAVAAWLAIAILFSAVLHHASASCQFTPREPYNPTGMEGCTTYGTGIASRWQGPGVARNDCLWPWTQCTPVRITSLQTGRSIVVQPSMFCDCYTGTERERLVDLDPAAVRALGLNWADGLYPVRVAPAADGTLPDTAMP